LYFLFIGACGDDWAAGLLKEGHAPGERAAIKHRSLESEIRILSRQTDG
jgi:hypothetical protein